MQRISNILILIMSTLSPLNNGEQFMVKQKQTIYEIDDKLSINFCLLCFGFFNVNTKKRIESKQILFLEDPKFEKCGRQNSKIIYGELFQKLF